MKSLKVPIILSIPGVGLAHTHYWQAAQDSMQWLLVIAGVLGLLAMFYGALETINDPKTADFLSLGIFVFFPTLGAYLTLFFRQNPAVAILLTAFGLMVAAMSSWLLQRHVDEIDFRRMGSGWGPAFRK